MPPSPPPATSLILWLRLTASKFHATLTPSSAQEELHGRLAPSPGSRQLRCPRNNDEKWHKERRRRSGEAQGRPIWGLRYAIRCITVRVIVTGAASHPPVSRISTGASSLGYCSSFRNNKFWDTPRYKRRKDTYLSCGATRVSES